MIYGSIQRKYLNGKKTFCPAFQVSYFSSIDLKYLKMKQHKNIEKILTQTSLCPFRHQMTFPEFISKFLFHEKVIQSMHVHVQSSLILSETLESYFTPPPLPRQSDFMTGFNPTGE